MLNILKIAGFVLLGIVALIILVILLFLFYPFVYKINASKYEEFKGEFVLDFFFNAIRVKIKYDSDGPLLTARVLGIKVYTYDFSGSENASDDAGDDLSSEGETDRIIDEIFGDGTDPTADKSIKEVEMLDVTSEDVEKALNDFDESSDKSSFKDFISSIKKLWYNLTGKYEEIKSKVTKFCKTVKYYWKVLHSKSFEPAMKVVKITLKDLYKLFKPKKIKAEITYGNEDPYIVAEVYKYYCFIYPFYGKNIIFNVLYDTDVLEGYIYAKGRFMLFRLLFIVGRAYGNRHLRRMIKLFKREGKKRGR